PDFFDVKQFPLISFKSTSVKAGAAPGSYEGAGDLTMHGQTRPITFTLTGGKAAEFPRGGRRTRFSTELGLQRARFGNEKFKGALGDAVRVAVAFEGRRK